MSELAIQRKLTHEFILTQPVTIVLQPRVKVRGTAGGFIWQNTLPRPPQVMRLIEPSTVQTTAPGPVIGNDGIQREIKFLLLGEWDAVIGLHDVFEYQDHHWEIVQLAYNNGWKRLASVARYG